MSRDLLKRKYELVPQMKDYDGLGVDPKPYFMYFHKPLMRLKSLTTDENGFRNSVQKDQRSILTYSNFSSSTISNRGIVVGGSTSWGVGSTGDQGTIASLLNRNTEGSWFNFAGRAFNSTQELILFLQYFPKGIQNVVIFSGINNIVLPFQIGKTSSVFNPLFFQNQLERMMSLSMEETLGFKYRAVRLMKDIGKRLRPGTQGMDIRKEPVRCKDILNIFERDMRAWQGLANAGGFKIHFFLQPFAPWLAKEWSPQEKELFSILDQANHANWSKVISQIDQQKEAYVKGLKEACQRCHVKFYDMNEDEDFLSKDWLFVDRIHLTDAGYELAARKIIKEADL